MQVRCFDEHGADNVSTLFDASATTGLEHPHEVP
jgi:hypothetical protein